MLNRTCCMIGNKEISEEKSCFVAESLRVEITSAIQNGFTHFISSFENTIDLIFADIVVGLMDRNPNITLEAAISYSDRLDILNTYFQGLLDKCKIVGVTSLEQSEVCFAKRNRLMVDFSQRVIVFSDGTNETLNLTHYAKSLNKEIVFIKI